MVGWAGLILLPGQRWVVEILARVVIPLIIAAIYLFLMASNYATAPADAGFGTLDAVASLFTFAACCSRVGSTISRSICSSAAGK